MVIFINAPVYTKCRFVYAQSQFQICNSQDGAVAAMNDHNCCRCLCCAHYATEQPFRSLATMMCASAWTPSCTRSGRESTPQNSPGTGAETSGKQLLMTAAVAQHIHAACKQSDHVSSIMSQCSLLCKQLAYGSITDPCSILAGVLAT